MKLNGNKKCNNFNDLFNYNWLSFYYSLLWVLCSIVFRKTLVTNWREIKVDDCGKKIEFLKKKGPTIILLRSLVHPSSIPFPFTTPAKPCKILLVCCSTFFLHESSVILSAFLWNICKYFSINCFFAPLENFAYSNNFFLSYLTNKQRLLL